jgi:amidophosphoribosyltransferase
MCGIFGVLLQPHPHPHPLIYQTILNGITVLQHRGQDAAGISVFNGKKVLLKKGLGKVEEIFMNENGNAFDGDYGIGHVRYSTTGNLSVDESQPLYTNSPFGLSIVHNGNLTNTPVLREYLESNKVHINTTSDSEVLLNYFALLLKDYLTTEDDCMDDAIFKTVEHIHSVCQGSYSVIIMINGYGLVVFRDPRGIRPLCYGEKEGYGTVFSSESVAINPTQFDFVGDVFPGECIFITPFSKTKKSFSKKNEIKFTPCLFEYIYFARPESMMNGILVYQARKNMGEALANKIVNQHADLLETIDVVMPVPDSGRISALRAAYVLGKPYCEGLIKNNYIGRTFIMPTQASRNRNLRLKLNTIDQEIRGKTVLLIDDSIVRGNTSIQLVNLVKRAGAKKVVFASIAPPVVNPNVYGIAIPSFTELVAHNKTVDEVCQTIGADYLIYNDLDSVIEACRTKDIIGFETSCFKSSRV